MSFASDLLATIDAARALPGTLGLRPYRAFLLEGYWDGAYTGDGEAADFETELLVGGQPPKVRFLTSEQLALGGVPEGTCTVGPLTPSHTGGGVAASSLEGTSLAAGNTLHVRLLHSDGSEAFYRVTKVDKQKALRIMLTCEPVAGPERVPE